MSRVSPTSAGVGTSAVRWSVPTLWIFEDQLSPDLPMLAAHPAAPVLMVESDRAFRQWRYHKKRVVFLCAAMRHFAAELRSLGRTVHYHPLRAEGYRDSVAALRHHVDLTGDSHFVVVDPADHHTRAWVDTLPSLLGITVDVVPNPLFLTDRGKFAAWVRSTPRVPVMEQFYRLMRVKHGVLMTADRRPAGGRWNFDTDNRHPAGGPLLMPPPPACPADDVTRAVMAEVDRRFPDHPGSTDGFDYPVTRAAAGAAVADFLDVRLPFFGDVEDAMLADHRTLYHSRLSAVLNAGLVRPMDAVRGAESRYHAGRAPIHAVEGFVRQILGWREYVYGIYHAFMPEYRTRNSRGDTRPLPAWFWTGDTDMNCLRRTITDVVAHGYSHHIQRLMVTCNFATLAGLSPQAVADWFLAMYVDSHDWVVTPNVVGMAMNADGGTVATKPYVSSAAYIDRMSDYCGPCRYDPKVRVGPTACPFNTLYWTFLEDHREAVAANPRVAAVLKHLDRMPSDERAALRRQRLHVLERIAAPTAADGPGRP